MRPRALEAPYLAGLLLLLAVPALGGIVLAFTDFSGVGAPAFVGLENFARLAGDGLFWKSLGNSAIYVLVSVPLRLAAAVAFALLLHRHGRGIGSARAIAYLPTVIPDAAYALLWLWILNPLYGPLTMGITALGGTSPRWLTDPPTTQVAIAVMGAFQIGEAFVVALAARRAVPSSLYEAAAVDGASPWFALKRITVPMMAPILALLALRDVIFTFQMNFVPALVITGGGPRYATLYLPLYMYKTAFGYLRLGYASAMALVMFALTAIIIFVQYRLARRWRLA
ncbi:MAG: sugar ABC transporter permease [Actinomycetota bacterium]|nr:sugar ABC transporter permease [Actinomycetota bacterium]